MVRAAGTACRAQQGATNGVDRPIALLHIQNVNARIADMKSQTLLYGRSRRRARGFSLLEVLISIIILSFGLLGAVGLQATALKNNRDARAQSVAVGLARELGEMMRANAEVAVKTSGNPYHGEWSGTNMEPSNPSDCLNIGKTCATTTDVANAEMSEWLARVERSLSGARVKVCIDANPYNRDGLPSWDCDATPAGSGNAITSIKIGWTRETTDSKILQANDTAARPFVVIPVLIGK